MEGHDDPLWQTGICFDDKKKCLSDFASAALDILYNFWIYQQGIPLTDLIYIGGLLYF